MKGMCYHIQPLKENSVTILYTFCRCSNQCFLETQMSYFRVPMWSSHFYFVSPLVYSPTASFQFLMFSLKQNWSVPDMVTPHLGGRSRSVNSSRLSSGIWQVYSQPSQDHMRHCLKKNIKVRARGMAQWLQACHQAWLPEFVPRDRCSGRWELAPISCPISPTSNAQQHMTVPLQINN